MFKFSLIFRLAICLGLVFLPLGNLDQWLYDHFFKLRGSQKRETAIVLIRVSDAKVYQLLQQTVSARPSNNLSIEQGNLSIWLKPFYSEIIKKLQLTSPKLIVFTQFYDWVDSRKPDTKTSKNIIYSGIIDDENRIVAPSRLTDGDNYGFNNLFPDPDNVVRQSYLFYSYGSSLALAAQKALGSSPTSRDLIEPIRIDYRGRAGSFPSYNAWDIFNSDIVDSNLFRDRIILIGRESSPASDIDTPFGKMSKLELQANILDTFISHREIRLVPQAYSKVLALVALMVVSFIAIYYPITLAWILTILFCILITLINLFVFSELKLWLGISNVLVTAIGSHLILLGYTLRRQEESQWIFEQEAKYFKELDQFKNNFISLFSHDLKTPIAKIKAITHHILTENKQLPLSVTDGLKGIDRTSGDLARLISDILKITRLESMSLETTKEVIDLNRLVETSIADLKFLADEKQIKLTADLEPLFSIEGDQKLIQEVITNLIENAIKYGRPQTEVIIKTEEVDKFVTVSIKDQGMGIAKSDLPRVKEKFFRCKNVADTTPGTGLGLYLANYFVELHKGKLTIESELGQGTTVTFSLPVT